MFGVVMHAVCVVAGVAILVAVVLGGRRRAEPGTAARGILLDLAPAAGASQRSAALQRRLRRARVTMSVTSWRRRVAGGGVVVAAVLVLVGASPLGAALSAATVVRGGAGAILLVRRDRLRRAWQMAAPQLARCLAVELSTGCGLRTALLHAERCDEPLVDGFLRDVARRLEMGDTTTNAMTATVGVISGIDPRAGGAIRTVADIARLGDVDGQVCSRSLSRLADALTSDARSRRSAASAATEARFVAAALPLLTVAMCIVIAGISPHALDALSGTGAVVVGIAACCATAGVASVFAATRA